MSQPRPDSAETVRLLERAANGDAAAVDELLARHREAVRAFIAVRLDSRTRIKEDPSDIVNLALTECALRLDDFLKRRPMPFQLWVRATAHEFVLKARRKWRAQCRDVGREMKQPDTSSFALAHSIVGNGPSPSEDAQARELAERVAKAVEALDEDDREILTLRQVDDLAHKEIALMLDITEVNARQRYGRALIHLQQELKNLGVLGGTVE